MTVTLGGATVLALATLGGVTRNRNNPICVVSPKVVKASTMVTVACRCLRCYRSKLRQCKHSFNPWIILITKVSKRGIVLARFTNKLRQWNSRFRDAFAWQIHFTFVEIFNWKKNKKLKSATSRFGHGRAVRLIGACVVQPEPGAVFTTLYFHRNLQMGSISWSVCPQKAFPAFCTVVL